MTVAGDSACEANASKHPCPGYHLVQTPACIESDASFASAAHRTKQRGRRSRWRKAVAAAARRSRVAQGTGAEQRALLTHNTRSATKGSHGDRSGQFQDGYKPERDSRRPHAQLPPIVLAPADQRVLSGRAPPALPIVARTNFAIESDSRDECARSKPATDLGVRPGNIRQRTPATETKKCAGRGRGCDAHDFSDLHPPGAPSPRMAPPESVLRGRPESPFGANRR